MAGLTSRTAFSLLESLGDFDDINEGVQLPLDRSSAGRSTQQRPKPPQRPAIKPQGQGPAHPAPHPQHPPDVSTRITAADKRHTRLCDDYKARGQCTRPYCYFAHSQEELAAGRKHLHRRIAEERAKLGWVPPPEQNQKQKTIMCRNWRQDGFCTYGNRCYFAHGQHELRQRDWRSEGRIAAEPSTRADKLRHVPGMAGQAPPWQHGGSGGSTPSPTAPNLPPPPPPPSTPPTSAVGAVPMSGDKLAELLAAADLDGSDAHVPEAFICPITQVVMDDPVVAADGFSYERHAIQAWLTNKDSSPMTGERLSDTHLLPNHTLVAAMRQVLGDDACTGRQL